MFRLDHAVINTRDRMEAAVQAYRQLGFQLTPRGVHNLGSINHLMVFGEDYLELIGYPPGGDAARPELTESPVGLDGLVFDLPDPEGLSAQARAAGFAASAPQPLSRPAEGGEARFTTVRLARGSLAGGRVYFCRHLTPERVWQPHWQTHPNGACAIDRFWIAVPDPAAEAGRYARLVGARLLPGGPEKAFAAGGCVVELTTPEALQARFGALACDPRDLSGAPRSAYMAALGIRTRSMAALRACLARAGLHARAEGDSLIVAARDAMNVTLVFRPLEPAASP